MEIDLGEELLARHETAIAVQPAAVGKYIECPARGGLLVVIGEAGDRQIAGDGNARRGLARSRIANQQAAADREQDVAGAQIAEWIGTARGGGREQRVAPGKADVAPKLRDGFRIGHPEVIAEEAEPPGWIVLRIDDADPARGHDFEPLRQDGQFIGRGRIDIGKYAFDADHSACADKHIGHAVVQRPEDGRVTDHQIVRRHALERGAEVGGARIDPPKLGLGKRVTLGIARSAQHGHRVVAEHDEIEELGPDPCACKNVEFAGKDEHILPAEADLVVIVAVDGDSARGRDIDKRSGSADARSADQPAVRRNDVEIAGELELGGSRYRDRAARSTDQRCIPRAGADRAGDKLVERNRPAIGDDFERPGGFRAKRFQPQEIRLDSSFGGCQDLDQAADCATRSHTYRVEAADPVGGERCIPEGQAATVPAVRIGQTAGPTAAIAVSRLASGGVRIESGRAGEGRSAFPYINEGSSA